MSRTIEATPLSAPDADNDDTDPEAGAVQGECTDAREGVVDAKLDGFANNFPFPIDHAAF